MNTTNPINNNDDSFDWHEMSDEEWEESVRGALSEEDIYPRDREDPYPEFDE